MSRLNVHDTFDNQRLKQNFLFVFGFQTRCERHHDQITHEDPKDRRNKQQARVQERQQLKEVAEKLKQDIQNTGRAGNTTVSYESDGVHLNLDSSILFNSGSADLSDAVKQMLDKLVPDLKQVSSNPVIVAGYTDNVPVSKRSKYASNWELSSARAVTVMRYFVSKGAISESNVSVQAYAENKPKDSNDTDEGKAKNRRVEIIIQKINS